MKYDFNSMKIGDRVLCPIGQWGEPQRQVLHVAGQFASTQNPTWQFQAFSDPDLDYEREHYWVERTR